MSMTRVYRKSSPKIRTRKRVPEQFGTKLHVRRDRNRYRLFLVLIFGADFIGITSSRRWTVFPLLCLAVVLVIVRYHGNITGKRLYRHETFKTDGQLLWDYAVKFARWQHPAVGRGTRFAVSDSSYCRISVWLYGYRYCHWHGVSKVLKGHDVVEAVGVQYVAYRPPAGNLKQGSTCDET